MKQIPLLRPYLFLPILFRFVFDESWWRFWRTSKRPMTDLTSSDNIWPGVLNWPNATYHCIYHNSLKLLYVSGFCSWRYHLRKAFSEGTSSSKSQAKPFPQFLLGQGLGYQFHNWESSVTWRGNLEVWGCSTAKFIFACTIKIPNYDWKSNIRITHSWNYSISN